MKALVFVALSIGTLLASFRNWQTRVPTWTTEAVLGMALVAELFRLTSAPPALIDIPPDSFLPYLIGSRVLLLAALALWIVSNLRRWWFYLLIFGHVAIGLWVVHSYDPVIDVLQFQRDSIRAVLAGQNPYSLTFADPYKGTSNYYGEGLSVGGRLLFGYPYLPTSLLLVLPGFLAGDVRYAHVAAVALAAILMYRLASDTTGKLAAAAFLFTPWVFHLENLAWIDSFVALLFMAAVYARLTTSTATPWTVGFFLAVKQYAVLALPAMLWTFSRRTIAKGLLISAAITLPFALCDPHAFWHSVIWLQFRQPWRDDALSFAVWLSRLGFPQMPWLGFVTGGLAAVLVIMRRAGCPAAFARDAALVYIAFFAFSKQAFYNYYFLVVAALSCSIVVAHTSINNPGQSSRD